MENTTRDQEPSIVSGDWKRENVIEVNGYVEGIFFLFFYFY